MPNSILIPLLIMFASLSGVLAFLLLRGRSKTRRRMQQLAYGIRAAAETDSTEAIDDDDPLSQSINQLVGRMSEQRAELNGSESLLHTVLTTLNEIVLIHQDNIIMANENAAQLLGLTPDSLVNKSPESLLKPSHRPVFRQACLALLTGEIAESENELHFIDGSEQGMWVDAVSTAIEFQGKRSILTIGRDVNHRRNLQAAIERGRDQAQYTLESIGEGIITTDLEGSVEFMNRIAESYTGIDREEARGQRFSELLQLVDESDRRSLGDPVALCLGGGRRINMGRRAILVSRGNKHEHSVDLNAAPVNGPDGAVTGVVVSFQDVSEVRGLTRQMSYQAAHDALTGLVNRREFERRLQEAIEDSRSRDSGHVLCYLDLDHFKNVNDRAGHQAGDALLREIAGLLRSRVRDSDTVARIGGDEFAFLLSGCPMEKARQIADDTVYAIAGHRFSWHDHWFNVGVSIGLVEISDSSGSIDEMMSAADTACYVAKNKGRGQVTVYAAHEEIQARERGDIHWLKRLQVALSENSFQLATQPIISLNAPKDCGPAAEVFLRLENDRGEAVSPKEFLLAAERYQLMPQIDRWVVQHTLAVIGSGDLRIPQGRSCSINLSGQTLGDEDFLEFVVDCLDRSAVAPSFICFEMTENTLIGHLQYAQRFIEVLHGMGCEFALDDFGSGLGAFSKLKHLPIDYLKIDGSFTGNLQNDRVNKEMIGAMVALAKTMNFKTVAEEVEQGADFDVLRDMGVDFAQGYFVDRPTKLANPSSLAARHLH